MQESEIKVGELRRITDRSDTEFAEFDRRISGQLQRIQGMRDRVVDLLQRQEQHINKLAVDAIRQQQRHIVQLRLNARFELAKLYDELTAEPQE